MAEVTNPQAQAGNVVQVRASPIVIGGPAQTPQADFAGLERNQKMTLSTMEMLNKVAGGVIQQYVNDKKQEMYIEGIVRAQAGESAASVKADQLFGGLFGDGVAAAAARSYETMTSTANAVNGIIGDMESLAELTPDQFMAETSARVKGQLTGDTASDSVILQKFTEMTPALMDSYSASRLKYQDKQAEKAWINGAMVAADTLDTTTRLYTDGKSTGQAVDDAKSAMALAAAPMPGMRPSAVEKGYANLYRTLVAKGSFHSVDILEQAGVMGMVSPQTAIALQNERDVGVAKFLAFNPAAQNVQGKVGILKYKAQLGQFNDEDDVINTINELNQEAGQETGITWKHVVDNNEQEQLLMQYRIARDRNIAAAQKAQAGLLSEMEENDVVHKAMFDPTLKAVGALVGIKDERYQIATRQTWNKLSPEEQQKYITSGAINSAAVADSKLRIPQVQHVLEQGLASIANGQTNQFTVPAMTQAAAMLAAPSGVEGLTAYVGADKAALYEEILSSGFMPGGDRKQNDEIIRHVSARTRRKPGADDIAAAEKVAGSLSPGFFGKVFGTPTLVSSEAAGNVAQDMAGIIAQLRANYPGASEEDLTKMAAIDVKNRFDFVGGVPIRRDARKGQVSMEAALQAIPDMAGVSMTSPLAQQAINDVITKKVPEGFRIIGGVNSVGAGANHIAIMTVVGNSGQRHVVQINAGEIAARIKQASLERASTRKRIESPSGIRFGAPTPKQ